jgi:hypothetical protein
MIDQPGCQRELTEGTVEGRSVTGGFTARPPKTDEPYNPLRRERGQSG